MFGRLRSSPLFRRESPATTARDAIGWWESRRIPYNLIVGCAGILSCIAAGVVAVISVNLYPNDAGIPDPPIFILFGIILYGIIANILYTGGWVVELLIRKAWPREADRFATLSFASGLVFSVLLTLTPFFLFGAAGIVALVKHYSKIAP